VAGAWLVAVRRTRIIRATSRRRESVRQGQAGEAARAAWRDARRNPALWALFVIVPVVFIWTADAVTPDVPITITVIEYGTRTNTTLPMPTVHGATMAPIAIASLAALVGLFAFADSRDGDRRAALAGMRVGALIPARLGVVAGSGMLAAAVSLAATAVVVSAVRWPTYGAGNVLLALTYGLIGVLIAPLAGRVGGVFLAFLIPFLDIGITQSPMLHPEPTTLSRLLPGYGGSRVLLDGALTAGFDETGPLLVGVAWLVGLLVAVGFAHHRAIAPASA
jgi:hypothetical protein